MNIIVVELNVLRNAVNMKKFTSKLVARKSNIFKADLAAIYESVDC